MAAHQASIPHISREINMMWYTSTFTVAGLMWFLDGVVRSVKAPCHGVWEGAFTIFMAGR